MTGSDTGQAILRHLAAVVAAAIALVTLSAGVAGAHELSDYSRQRAHIKQRARSQLGAPYKYGGTTPDGFDCSGFTRWVFKNHGERLSHSSMDQFRLWRKPNYKRIWKRRNLQKGDLVFHKTTSAKVGHVGIYIGNGNFISATSSSGVRRRSIYDKYYWGPRWVAGVRTPSTRR
jgi:cell wall-associated NlpC family hydrolase